jgi:hypothetical protein
MSNSNKPFGLRLVGMLTGGSGNVHIGRYRVSDSNALYMGDPVERVTSSSQLASPVLNQVDGLEFVKRAAGADNQNLLGVVVGFAFDPTNLAMNYLTAAQATAYQNDVFVCDDPNALFEIQSDVTGIAYTDLGKNCLMTVTAGSTTTGISKCVATGPAADASYPLLIVGFSRDPKNDITSAAYTKVIVKINNHQLVVGAGYGALGV